MKITHTSMERYISKRKILKFSLSAMLFVFVFGFTSHPVYAWNLQGSCSATPSSTTTGSAVTWSAVQTSTMKDGQGHYEYSWSGDDFLSGATQTLSKTYTTAGTKNATVVISLVLNSGVTTDTITRHCSLIVTALNPPPPPTTPDPLGATCSVTPSSITTGQSVSWSVTASGGTGTYAYSWTGTEGLSGTTQTLSKTYSTNGRKTGTVSVTSANDTITRTCELSVALVSTPPPGGGGPATPLSATCSVSSTLIDLSGSATWTAHPSGGTGTYTYAWEGSDGLSGTTNTVTQSYNSSGTKTARVTVVSGNETVTTDNCSTVVKAPSGGGGGGGCSGNCGGGGGGGGGIDQPTVVLLKQATTKSPLAFVYLSQVPYTGLSDHWGLVIFLFALLLWSSFVAYFIQSKVMLALVHKIKTLLPSRFHVAHARVHYDEDRELEMNTDDDVLDVANAYGEFAHTSTHHIDVDTELEDSTNHHSMKYAPIPHNIPTDNSQQNNTERDLRDLLARHAREQKVLISDDALKSIINGSSGVSSQAMTLLEKVLKTGEEKFTKEDGWLLLNKERMTEILTAITGVTVVAPKPTEVPARAQPVFEQPPVVVPQTFTQTNVQTNSSIDSKTFLLWMARSESAKIQSFLKTLKQQGTKGDQFVKSVVFDLDRIYRARLEDDASVTPELLQLSAGWTNEQIEEMISILFSIIEQQYKNTNLGMKVAVMRMLETKQFKR